MSDSIIETWTTERALERITACEFECTGGQLRNNAAWQWLVDRIKVMETTLQAIAAMGPKEEPDYSKNAFNSGDDVDFGIALANHGTAELARKALAGGGSQASAGTDELESVYAALSQAQDCIRGETPENISDEEAREDTINKVRDAMRTIEGMQTAPQASAGSEGEMHAAIKAWLDCPKEKRPSAAALGKRIEDIATSSDVEKQNIIAALQHSDEVVLEQSEWKGNWVQTVRLPSGEEIVRTVPQQSADTEPVVLVEGDAPQMDRVFIGKGEYVRADEATKTIMDLQRNLRHWREECGKLHARMPAQPQAPSNPEAGS